MERVSLEMTQDEAEALHAFLGATLDGEPVVLDDDQLEQVRERLGDSMRAGGWG